jgi:DNA-binding HxlR family transcriptional regulator
MEQSCGLSTKEIRNPRKMDISQLNKAFENRIRLGIMGILMVQDWIDFNSLKEQLKVTDGNLSSHLANLEKFAYTEIKKEFIGRKPKTSYRVTPSGKAAFEGHLVALETILNSMK